MKSILSFCFYLFSVSFAFADPNLIKLFEQSFISHYEPARCGDNIIGLVDRAEKANLNLYNAKILTIENKGGYTFGMINVEYARESGRLNPSYPGSDFRNLPGDRNWYHHVVLEKDGLIYDYDFGNEPKPTKVAAYFEKMFLDEKKNSNSLYDYVGREEKLKSYQVTIVSALDVLEARRKKERSPNGVDLRLNRYLSEQ